MLEVISISGFSSFQDLGRSGFYSKGISRSGAADYYALFEGAALLDQDPNSTALEFIGNGGTFNILEDCMVALTGASMPASLNQKPLDWNASHYLLKGGILNLGAPQNGRYSYLHLRGGFTAPKIFNSSSAQPSAGIGKYSIQADILAQSEKNLEPLKCQAIKPFDRFNSTTFRLIESFQTHFFTSETVERFTETEFLIDNQSNRSGIKLTHTGSGFSISNQLKIVSDMIVPGDIQMTGSGQPFVLLGDCQTMGGYPRIGCLISPDIPAIAQLKSGKKIKFKFISRDEANKIVSEDGKKLETITQRCSEPIRDPQKITDLMDLNLIGGAVWAKD
tara:strand:+ start:1022 stop:2023 length:1002 start_codon:yes stop_codon:yes gene_type:complete